MSEVAARVLWLLHFPYPDGTWRGLEKCMGIGEGAIWEGSPSTMLLFEEESAAQECASRSGFDPVPVRVMLTTPGVRQPLDSAGVESDALADLQREVAQLKQTLALERFEQTYAPDGWHADGEAWCGHGVWVCRAKRAWDPQTWIAFRGDRPDIARVSTRVPGDWPTALEAMKALTPKAPESSS